MTRLHLFFALRGEKTSLHLTWLFLRIDGWELMEKRRKKQAQKKEKKPKEDEKKKEAGPQTKTRDILGQLKRIFSYVKKEFTLFRKHILFEKLDFSIAFSTGDAAQTAIAYGGVCTLVYNFFPILTIILK
jgi:large-conductance mechanosensitive channel